VIARSKYIIIGLLLLLFCSTIMNAQKRMGPKVVEYEVKEIFGLNSENAEFSPVWYNQKLVFSSDREYDLNSIGEGNWNGVKFINVFTSEVKSRSNDSVVFDKVKIFDHSFIGVDHVGPVCFTNDGKEAIFSLVSHRKQKVFGKVQYRPYLYSAKLIKGKWNEFKRLNFVKINYSYSQPSLSGDGNTLYFTSDALETTGGKDIFMSTRTSDGWTDPIIVNGVNSEQDEMFPTIHGSKLYFSSNREGGSGALDIYEAELKDSKFLNVRNLGSTINTEADDFSMLFNPNKESGYFSSNRNGNDDIFYFNLIEKVTMYEDDMVSGQFTYRYLKDKDPSGLEVQMLDDEGNVIYRTTTDENGEFVFKKLPSDGKYTIKLLNDGEEVELTLYGKDSDTFLISDENGSFVYRRLNSNDVGTLSLMDSEDVDLDLKEGTMNGQFVYRKLNGESPGGMDVYLVDDEGNIVMRTKTDEYGNFEFKKLPLDKSYTIQTENNDNDMDLMLFNKYDEITATLAKDSNGNFVYRKLKSDHLSKLELMSDDADDLEFSERTMAISGLFKYSKMEGNPDNMEFEILDGEGNFLMRGKTDENGYFNYKKLPLSDEIMFKLDEESVYFDQKIDLEILSRSRDILINLYKDEKGFFTYRRLNSEKDVIKTIEVDDQGELVLRESKVEKDPEDVLNSLLSEITTVYYNRDDKKLTEHDKKMLDNIVVKLIDNKGLKVKLDSYASSRGDKGHNMRLSQRRVDGVKKYLTRHGIPSSRIITKAHGEAAEDGRCKGVEECIEAMHRLNRKTEIQLIK